MGRMRPSIVNAGYRSTNYWVVSAGRRRLIVDLGWPGRIGALVAALRRLDVPLAEVEYGVATHYHIDHAGCAEDLKAYGMRLIVTPEQLAAIPRMAQWVEPGDGYTPITPRGTVVVPLADSRAFLAPIGIHGELVHTPGHSDDSISLVLDSGDVFTGDLTRPGHVLPEDTDVVDRSWRALVDRGATMVFPGHGAAVPIAAIWPAR